MLNKALQHLQSLALHQCGAMRSTPQTAVPRQLNLPLRAFDELQAIKRRHGLTRNVDAVAYGLFMATLVDHAAMLPSVDFEAARGASNE